MKTNIAHKKGFTIVELVIVIAVIAILAAVLIPTFVNLVQKANDAAALADARNMANQLLINLLEHDAEGAKDLLVIQKKADGIYVHAYSASEGRVIAYKNNPVSIDELKELATTPETADEDGETAEPDEAEQYAGIVETLLLKLQSEAAIQLCDPQPAEDDWSHPNQMPTIVETLGYNNSEIAFRTNYVVIATAFENITIDPEHKCSKDTLTHYDAQEATCTLAGRAEYWMCTECGKLFSDADATTEIDDIDIKQAEGHSWNEGEVTTKATCQVEGVTTFTCSACGATKTKSIDKESHNYELKYDADNHWKECTKCGRVSGKTEHTYNEKSYTNESGKYYRTCTECKYKVECNEAIIGQPTIKAMELNAALATSTKHATMYDAFKCVAGDGEISTVIAAIKTAEGITGQKIVWDQTIDRFVVVEDSNGTSPTIVYTPADCDGLAGKIARKNAYLLWDVYDEEHSVPSSANDWSYSCYWGGVSMPSIKNGTVAAGFDIGEYQLESDETLSIIMSQPFTDYDYCTIVRTNQLAKNGKINITLGSTLNKSNISHYGRIDKLYVTKRNNELKYYEYGSVEDVAISTSMSSSYKHECQSLYKVYAKQGSIFSQTKAELEAFVTFVESNGTFGN